MLKAEQITNWILSKVDYDKGDSMSPLKLQKLLYYCQGWYLAVIGDKLFEEDLQAWAHGPVVPSEYYRFEDIKRYDSIPKERISDEPPIFKGEAKDILEEVFDVYNEHSASYLENLTHQEKPWVEARKGVKPFEISTNPISTETMKSFFKSHLKNG